MAPNPSTTTTTMPSDPPTLPWHHHLTLDLVLHTLSRSLLHPFVAFMFPLSARALAAPLLSPSFLLSCAYAILVSLAWLLSDLNKRVAYGKPREIDWGNEVVVVTGGANGLGRCVAEMLGMRGWGVAILDLEGPEVEEGEGGVRYWKCDVGDRGEVERVWAEVVRDLGTPTVLINNAAVANAKPFLDLTVKDVEQTFRTNTLSHYHLTSLFLPALLPLPTGGHLITISSVLAHLGASHLSAYTASKAALIAFHSSITAELSQLNPAIKTTLVTPGQMDTGLFEGVEVRGWWRRFLGPVVEGKEVAREVVRLVEGGRGGLVAVPAYAGLIGWMGVLPVGVRKLVRGWSGVDESMSRSESGGERDGALEGKRVQ